MEFEADQLAQINEQNIFFCPLTKLINYQIGDGKIYDNFLQDFLERLPADLKAFCELVGIDGSENSPV